MQPLQNNLSSDKATVDGLDTLFDLGTSNDMTVTPDVISSSEITADSIDTWTLLEAADELNVSTRTILRKLKKGELQGHKIVGLNGPEWRIYPVDTQDMTPSPIKIPVQTVTPDDKGTVDTTFDTNFQALLKVLESQAEQLKAASQVIMYQKEQLEEKDKQIRLLEDSQHKKDDWWSRLKKRVFKKYA